MNGRLSDRLLTYLYQSLCIVVCVLLVAIQCGLWDRMTLSLCLAIVVAALLRIRHSILNRFRRNVFKPIKLRSLPWATRKYFRTVSRELEDVGFTQLGDFLLQPDPHTLSARFLISAGRKCLTQICDREREFYFSFISVTADGRFFKTGSLNSDPPVGEGVPLDVVGLPHQELLIGLAWHIERVRHYAAEAGTEILEIEPDRFQDVVNYGHRLAGHDGYEQGVLNTAPEPLQPEETVPVAIH